MTMQKLSADIMHFLLTGAGKKLDPLAESIARFTEVNNNGNPIEIIRYRNLTYLNGEPRDAIRRKLDLYLPDNRPQKPPEPNQPPLILFVHGGRWRIGSKDDLNGLYGRIARKFTANNIAFAVTNYRLTPRVQHPGHIRDVAAALAWLCENADTYNYSPDNIFLMGHSSGGQLVSLLTLDNQYLTHHHINTKLIKGVITLSGVFNLMAWPELYTVDQTANTIPPFNENTIKSASPASHIHPDALPDIPPFLLIHEEFGEDMIRETKQFAALLRKSGIQREIITMPDTDHISMLIELIRKHECDIFNKIISFVKRHDLIR